MGLPLVFWSRRICAGRRARATTMRMGGGHAGAPRPHGPGACVATRLKSPPLAGAASLRERGRSVRAQAPVQDEFAKGCRAGRTGSGGDQDHRARPGFEHEQRREDGNDGKRRLAGLHAVRHHDVDRFAAVRARSPICRRLRWLGRVAVTTGRRLFHRHALCHATERAVICEHETAQQSHRDDDRAQTAVGADEIQNWVIV